jgi:hypothetical protein
MPRWLLPRFWVPAALLLLAWPVVAQTPLPPTGVADANAPPIARSLESLATLLMRVESSKTLFPTAALANAGRARQAVSRLQALSIKWPAQSPADYRTSLDRQVRALAAVLDGADTARRAAVLEALAEDLETKLEHCIKSGGKLGGSVTVRVRTVGGGREVRNWQIFYLPKVLEATGGAPDRFPQLSSPTSEILVPGRYVVWPQDPTSGRVGARAVLKVGEGRSNLIFDLLVPAF